MLRVLLATHQPLWRAGLRAILESASDLELLDAACEAHELRRLCSQLVPDVLLLDILLPDLDLWAFIAQIRSGDVKMNLLLLTPLEQVESISARRSYLFNHKGMGALLINEPLELWIDAIRTIGHGGAWFSLALLKQLVQPPKIKATLAERYNLSEKELAIVRLLTQGKTDAKIAQQQGISARTVRYYMRNICDKLAVRTRIEVAVQAGRLGIIDENTPSD